MEGIARDITEHKNAEEKLNKSEEKYRLLFENMINGFAIHEIVLNNKGKPINYIFLETNPFFEQITGLKRKNIIGKKVTDVLPGIEKDPADFISKYGKVVLTGKEIRFEQYSKNLDKWFSILAFRNKKNQFATIFEDITARKHTEEEVAKVRTYLDRSLSSAPLGVFLLDEQGIFTYVNPVFQKMFGYKEKDFVGKKIQEVVPKIAPPKTAKILQERAKRRLRTGEPIIEAEVVMINKKGISVPTSYSASGIKDDSGNIIGEVVFLWDITERTKAQKTLMAERNKFKSLIDGLTAAGIGIDIVGLDYKIYYQNKLLEDAFGKLSGGELCYETYKGFKKPCDECNIDKALKEKKPFGREERGSDNKIYNILSAPITNYEGKGNKVLEVITDITERKKAEKELEDSENRFKRLSQSSEEGIVFHDNGKVIDANNAAAKMLGVALSDLIGMNALNLLTPVSKKTAGEKIKKGNMQLYEIQFKNPNGKIIDVEVIGKPTYLKGRNVRVTVIRDITKRKKAENELIKSYHKTERALRGTIETLATIVETRDPYTSGHQKRVAQLATSISEEIGLTKEKIEATNISALLHDIGKMNIPASILAKPGKISDIEYTMIKTHPQQGYSILKNVEFSWSVADIILQHHEKEDGSGYPNGLKGKDILTEAKIILVADVVEAMSSHRPYRPALGIDKAIEEIKKNKDKLYDPKVVDACIKLFKNKDFRFKD